MNNPISVLTNRLRNIANEVENSIQNKSMGVATNTPILQQWEMMGYEEVYCKRSGWFAAYRKYGQYIDIYDMIYQQEMTDSTDFHLPPHYSPNQKLNVFDSWDYVKDANFGFAIVRNQNGLFNYLDLNGDLLIKDNYGNPLWFDQLSVFYDGSGDDRLYAFGEYHGKIAYVYSNGSFLLTKKTYSSMGIETIMESINRKHHKYITITESDLRKMIRETLKRILYS